MSEPASPGAFPPLSPFATGLMGRCPRCGKASIFEGFLALKPRCSACDLDLSTADTGDGPAFFASFFGGFVLLAVGVWLQASYEPPVWTYVLLFIVGALLIVGLIRPVKGLLAALQYTNKAEQGRFEP